MLLKDNVALITGASRGLGLEIARLYVREGARVAIVARGGDALHAAARSLGGDVLPIVADVSLEAERVVAETEARFGRVDVLINNASTIGSSPMPALDVLDWRELSDMFRVNVLAPMHLAQLVLPGMRARRRGLIVNVTSDAAVSAYPGWGGYGTTKAALEHLTRIFAAENEGTGVRMLLVDPGDMNTRMHAEAEPGVDISHLPLPSVPAPHFVRLVNSADAAIRSQAMAVEAVR